MPNTPDLSSMSKEEIAAYYEKLLAEQAMTQSRTILNLKKEIAKTLQKSEQEISAKEQIIESQKAEIEVINSDRRKLRQNISNQQDLIENILSSVREHQSIYSKYLQEENIPMVDTADLHELNLYFEGLMLTLFNAVGALLKHQERSLNLGTSEKSRGGSPKDTDYSADDTAEQIGREELENAGEIETEDLDRQDFESQSEEHTEKTDSAAEGLSREQIDTIVLSGCSSHKKQDISSELGDAIRLVADTQKTLKAEGEKQTASKKSQASFISVCDSEQVAGILTHAGERVFKMYCPVCGRIENFELSPKKKRINSILTMTDSLNSLGTVLSTVQLATCSHCGASVEINPASLTDISLTLTSGKAIDLQKNSDKQAQDSGKTGTNAQESHSDEVSANGLDEAETDNKKRLYRRKTADEQKERRTAFNQIKNNAENHNTRLCLSEHMLNRGDGTLPVINPALFNAQAYGMTPVFTKSRISASLLAACGTQFCQLGAPKNRTFRYFEGNGFTMSREHLTGAINAFARAYLHPVTEYIRAEIVKQSPAVILDESTLLVRTSAAKKAAEGRSRKSQIWTLNSNWTSDIQASWFCVSDSRSFQNVIDILGDEIKAEEPKLKYLTSDGYAGYDSAVRLLQEQGISIKNTRCWAHARRPLYYVLRDSGLLKIYNNYLLPAGASFTDFEANLKKYRSSKAGEKLTDKSASLLTIYWMINAIFALDSAVVRKHQFICTSEEFKAELLKVRQEKSSLIVDAVFDSIRMLIASNPELISCTLSRKGDICYRQNRRYPESRALIYLLKFEKDLRVFTESADVEITSSAAERSLKLGICLRHACMYLHGTDGAHAFADFNTIINTCIKNRVPVQHYLIWLTANMKWRMNKMRCEGHDDPTFFSMPGRKKLLDNDRILPMYDKENRIGYDKVDVSGLTPYDYRKYLEDGLKI